MKKNKWTCCADKLPPPRVDSKGFLLWKFTPKHTYCMGSFAIGGTGGINIDGTEKLLFGDEECDQSLYHLIFWRNLPKTPKTPSSVIGRRN